MFELKPCPFCGGEAVIRNNYTVISPWYVLCSQCFASTDDADNEEQAAEFWNRRAKPKRGHWSREVLSTTNGYGSYGIWRCDCCGYASIEKSYYCPNCGADMRETNNGTK